ncbi:uncharacterized protein [Physcomitrium patens]|uniref:Uncharacterized protein n=2 Tax=Physcomitrium patens TaxID=3218 RepID=A9TK14_PHYPA|nr:uncharacterized protein LOC112292195 [Physcomitrium patens]PNR39532.1 hypothetical protein PHYPA_019810 [Physcomitrium patens]|eukprot:XP_024396217.1 uncharacterized protein LOC112292195 [Physcomitrella patens]
MDNVYTEKTLQRQGSKLSKPRPTPRVKLWTRLSPLHLFRLFRDTYVRGCVTFGNSSKVNAIAHASPFQIICDDNTFSRSNSRHVDNMATAQELLDFSSKFSRQGSSQGSLDLSGHFSRQVSKQEAIQAARDPRSAMIITGYHGLTMEDLQGYSGSLCKTGASGLSLIEIQGYSGPLRTRPSFDTVPESEQFKDTRSSKLALENLFQTSALHPTEFLHSSSRRVEGIELYKHGHLSPGHTTLTRGGSERPVRRPHPGRHLASASVSRISNASSKPLSPITDLNSFREQPDGRKSYDLPRASSRRRERFGSTNSSGSLIRPVDYVVDFPRSRSKNAANRPNPYREYDTRVPSPTTTV